jgi:hypothetical protein
MCCHLLRWLGKSSRVGKGRHFIKSDSQCQRTDEHSELFREYRLLNKQTVTNNLFSVRQVILSVLCNVHVSESTAIASSFIEVNYKWLIRHGVRYRRHVFLVPHCCTERATNKWTSKQTVFSRNGITVVRFVLIKEWLVFSINFSKLLSC